MFTLGQDKKDPYVAKYFNFAYKISMIFPQYKKLGRARANFRDPHLITSIRPDMSCIIFLGFIKSENKSNYNRNDIYIIN